MILTTWQNELRTKSPASNGRFCEMATVAPQTILWEIERYYPAASVVEAATSQSRWDVIGKSGSAVQFGSERTERLDNDREI